MATSFHSKPISTLHLSWAAGFIEGEGSFSGGKVTAAQVQKEPVERLQAMLGGKLSHRQPKGHGAQPIWIWSLTARRSIEVMMTLYVLMSPRRQQQIEVCLAVWKAQKRILKSHASRICGNGHALEEENIYITPGGHRKCRQCRIDIKAALRLRRRAGLPARKRVNWRPDRGENHVSAKFKNNQIGEILTALSDGNTGISLAKKYGVSTALISAIKRGRHRASQVTINDTSS